MTVLLASLWLPPFFSNSMQREEVGGGVHVRKSSHWKLFL